MSLHQNARQNHNLKITNKPMENMARFEYLGMRTTNQNCIYGEITSR
jgi:hypothetical protein